MKPIKPQKSLKCVKLVMFIPRNLFDATVHSEMEGSGITAIYLLNIITILCLK